MLIILANFKEAQRYAREHGLARRDWIWGGSTSPLRGFNGPLEPVVSPTWYSDYDRTFTDAVEQRIALVNSMCATREATP